MTSSTSKLRLLSSSAAAVAIATVLASVPAQAIVPNENTNSENIVDTAGGVNGIGQFFRNDGSTCTGSLINPRTVLFAAHCVNDRPESDFGPTIQSAFSFNVDALPGLQNWFANGFTTNASQFVYNISQIQYDPRSLANPAALGFIEADIALATLDTPAADIPTWALLFSVLPDPGAIDPVNGTGYHVNISGFGATGTALTGADAGSDFRRRAAENILGAFTSQDDRNNVLFGGSAGNLPQNLYSIDFDSQDRAPFADFNLFRDDALPNEGTTASGDSGGPLILDAANNDITDEDLLIGTLSGGSRFFGAQPFSALGTQSFYQPIFLFWEYIAEANPYRYVGTVAGDGDWEDASHWTSLLDPNYRIIDANGNVVNGIPTTREEGVNGTEGDFGSVCVEFGTATDACTDLATGVVTSTAPTATTSNNTGSEDASDNVTEVFFDTVGRVDVGIVAGTVDTGYDKASEAETTSAGATSESVSDTSEVETASVGVTSESVSDTNEGEVVTTSVGTTSEGVSETSERAIVTTSVGTTSQPLIEFAIDQAQSEDNDPTVEFADDQAQSEDNDPAVEFAVDQAQDEDSDETSTQDGEVESEAETDESAPLEVGGTAAAALPPPTIENGLPGATNFVANNVDADVANGISGRFFDVTLSNAGTTTLSSVVEVDNLAVTGTAGLNVAGAGDLTSLLGVNQTGGSINVDGRLDSRGDYTIFTGVLSGTGTVVAPFITSIAGTISPGGLGTIGTLNVEGNLVLSSGSTYELDIDAAGNSDLITVTDPSGAGQSGVASVGGNVVINQLTNFLINDGDTYTILTADTSVDGEFTSNTFANSAVINPTFIVSDNGAGEQVDLIFEVSDYSDVVDTTSGVQGAYAALLDGNRGAGLSTFGDIFGFTELANAEALGATLESLAPFTETTQITTGELILNSVLAFNRTRLTNAFSGKRGGTVALNTNAQQLASAVNFGSVQKYASQENVATQGIDEGQKAAGLNNNFALFFTGGILNGQGAAMPSTLSTISDDIDGYFFAGGLEYLPGNNSVFGISVNYSDVDGIVGAPTASQTTTGELIHGSLYGAVQSNSGLVFDGQIGFGSYETSSLRNVSIGATASTLTTEDTSFVFTAEAGASKVFALSNANLTPRISLNYATISFGDVAETGGQAALQIQRDSFNSFQIRGGTTLNLNRDKPFRPWVRADYVHDFSDRDNSFGANFVGGTGGFAAFALAEDDSDWVEAAVGFDIELEGLVFGFSAETTIGRDDFQNQSYQGSVTFKF